MKEKYREVYLAGFYSFAMGSGSIESCISKYKVPPLVPNGVKHHLFFLLFLLILDKQSAAASPGSRDGEILSEAKDDSQDTAHTCSRGVLSSNVCAIG